MTDDILSQEELDALLKNAVGETSDVESDDSEEKALTDMEKDTLGEIGNISMGTAATTLSTLLGKKVDITTPTVEVTNSDELASFYKTPLVAVDVKYKEGLEGSNIMILRTDDVKVITDLMMGRDEVDLERDLTDLDLSAVSEAMNQMMGSSSTSLSEMLGMRIDILPPESKKVTLEEGKKTIDILKGSKDLIKISFKMVIEDYLDSNILQIIPLDFGKEMVQRIIGIYSSGSDTPVEVKEEQKPEEKPVAKQEVQKPVAQEPVVEYTVETNSNVDRRQEMNYNNNVNNTVKATQPVEVQRPTIPSFDNIGSSTNGGTIDLVSDIPVEITVELGRTHKKIDEILEFGVGTVVELDKLVGEPLNLFANGRYIASGEVVVIDDNFGIRVTEIDTNKQKMI